jgi:hypothetical protein
MWDNRQWFFSGLGVFLFSLIIAGLIALKRHDASSLLSKAQRNPATADSSPIQIVPLPPPEQIVPLSSPQKVESPSLTEAEKIISEIEAARPLQQEDVAKAYVGIPVDWNLFFMWGVSASKTEFELVFSSTPRRTGRYIACRVRKDTNAQLRLAPEGRVMRVRGVIKAIEGSRIYLKDAQVSLVLGQ